MTKKNKKIFAGLFGGIAGLGAIAAPVVMLSSCGSDIKVTLSTLAAFTAGTSSTENAKVTFATVSGKTFKLTKVASTDTNFTVAMGSDSASIDVTSKDATTAGTYKIAVTLTVDETDSSSSKTTSKTVNVTLTATVNAKA